MIRILLADDDKVIRDALGFSLKSEGYNVVTAEDGEQALELSRNQIFSLILSDLEMPKVSGLNLLCRLKDERNRETPVIVISSEANGNLHLAALELGASDFLLKPFTLEQVRTRVKKYVS